MTVDELQKNMDGEFAAVRAEFAAVRAEVRSQREETRRHFDKAVEHCRDVVRMLAEGTSHNTQRLDNHETRLVALEKDCRAGPR